MTVQWLEGLGKISEKREAPMSEVTTVEVTTESIAKKARKPRVTVYCAGRGEEAKFVVVATLEEARTSLGAKPRKPGTRDMKLFWRQHGLSALTHKGIAEKFDISLATAWNWAHRAGQVTGDTRVVKREVAIRVLRDTGSVHAAVKASGLTLQSIYRLASLNGITLARPESRGGRTVRFTAEEFIETAKGKTWKQLAAAMKITPGTARNYASRKKITAQLREVMVAGKPVRGEARKSVKRQRLQHAEVDTIISMLRDGTEPKEIAKALGLRLAVVNYWLLKGKKAEA
jgi:hypothetical protein